MNSRFVPCTIMENSHLIPVNYGQFVWNKSFAIRRIKAYKPGGERDPALEAAETARDVLQYLLGRSLSQKLHGTLDYSYASLRNFILGGETPCSLADLTGDSASVVQSRPIALVDDRCESVKDTNMRRNWDVYLQYPPAGDRDEILVLDEKRLYQRLSQKVLPTSP